VAAKGECEVTKKCLLTFIVNGKGKHGFINKTTSVLLTNSVYPEWQQIRSVEFQNEEELTHVDVVGFGWMLM
jgi:hypothetical protein